MMLLNIASLFLLSMPGGGEWVWLILAIVIFFGGRKIPELARGIGKGIREFNDAKDGVRQEIENSVKIPEKQANTSIDANLQQ